MLASRKICKEYWCKGCQTLSSRNTPLSCKTMDNFVAQQCHGYGWAMWPRSQWAWLDNPYGIRQFRHNEMKMSDNWNHSASAKYWQCAKHANTWNAVRQLPHEQCNSDNSITHFWLQNNSKQICYYYEITRVSCDGLCNLFIPRRNAKCCTARARLRHSY